MEQIFYDGKKIVLVIKNLRLNKMIHSNLQCFVRNNTVISPHDLAFQLIKSKKNYKAKFSTNLILKKKNQQRKFWKEKNRLEKTLQQLTMFYEENYSTFSNKIK